MKIISKNIEFIVVLFITFMIFVTLVIFYENKIEILNRKIDENKNVYDIDKNNNLVFLFTYVEKISDNYVKIENKLEDELIIYLKKDIIDDLTLNNLYKIYLDKNICDEYDYDIQKIINNNGIIKIVKEN